MTRGTKWLLSGLIAAVVVAAAVVGGYFYLRSRHDQEIEDRIKRYDALIWQHAQANSLPPELVRDVIRAESGGDERAVSPRGAKGLMQLTDIAVRELRRTKKVGEGDVFDPDYNIRAGTAYLREMFDKFNGDAYLAIAAYNMGDAELRKYRRDHPDPDLTGRQIVEIVAPPATKRYCEAILRGREFKLPK